MKIQPINNQTNFGAYRIDAKQNKDVKFLYNKVLDSFEKQGTTSVFSPNHITFERLTEGIKKKLDGYGIKYFDMNKKGK